MADRTCSVCSQQFSEPKILPCCHTFCLKCLERIARKKADFPCPLCYTAHSIPVGGLQDFLTDFVVSHEVEVADLKSSSAKKASVCGECEGEGPVESYCSDCQAYLCSECSNQLHKKLRSYRGHKVTPVRDLDATTLQSSKIYYCSTHKSEVMKLYCETCSKLICRDCTLVDHRQHSYKFAHDVRMQINSQLMSLVKDSKQRLTALKANLGEIQRVETTATSYPEVCKADINAYFDAAIQSIEKRRQHLLTQAETEGQKDLKQIWADKDFHQATISHFDAALGLANKAHKCTSDVEMILTAQQSIRRLLQLKQVEWDASEFIMVASSPGHFTERTGLEANRAGCIKRKSFNNVVVQHFPTTAKLGQTITFKIMETLVDGRSKQKICLQNAAVMTRTRVQVLVKYGHAQKLHKNVSIQQDQTAGGLVVSVRLVCGGKHVIEIEYDGKPVRGNDFTLNVTGTPKVGARVRHGPDWIEQCREVGLFGGQQKLLNEDVNEEGTVQQAQVHQHYGVLQLGALGGYRSGGLQLGVSGGRHSDGLDFGGFDDQCKQETTTHTTVSVYWDKFGYTCSHNWGGTYEIELV